ncbi:serine hydrolase domain-containing protein [Dokdonella ginsengisoli]|uniref:Serine hydrolase domain-containing protein n=1 Tax=Dokdonella ginsengisoli TaxID=363846 RepID=A0ABV9QTP6_9GAMM
MVRYLLPAIVPFAREAAVLRSFVLATSLLGLVSASALADSLGPDQIRRIDADVTAILDRTRAPSAVVAVVRNDRIVFRKAYGFRDSERRLAADVGSLYEIGSITKQFTAAAIVQLRDEGKLALDDKLSNFLPDAPHADEVTLRQLLSHTSGLPEYLDGPDIEEAATRPATFAQLMARIAGKPLVFAPGSKMAYNNTGYILLGRVVEVVSHRSYRDYVRTHLLDRAGMKRTFTVADESRLAGMAIGYQVRQGTLQRAPTIHDSFGWAAGNLVSTVDDLASWSTALARGKIVNKKSYEEMTTPAPVSEGTSDYGLGLFVDSVRDQPRIGHTGGSFGFTTADEFFPKQNLRVIAFTNGSSDPEPGEMITNAIFDDLFPEIAAAARKAASGENPEITTQTRALFEELQRGSGDYSTLGGKLAAKMKNGLAGRLADRFSPFGSPTRFIYKGARSEGNLHWHDYLIEFGPGSQLKFSIGLDEAAKIASISYG